MKNIRRIIRLDELGKTFVVRLVLRPGAQDALYVETNYLSKCVVQDASKESTSRRIMCLVPVFMLQTHIIQTDNASLVIKRPMHKMTVKIEL